MAEQQPTDAKADKPEGKPAAKPPDRWEMAIIHLARGCSAKQTCKLTGIGRTQLRSRLRDQKFLDRLAAYQKETAERATKILASSMVKSAMELRKLLGSESENMRFKASVAILESGSKMQEIREAAEEHINAGTLLRPDEDARAMDATIPSEPEPIPGGASEATTTPDDESDSESNSESSEE